MNKKISKPKNRLFSKKSFDFYDRYGLGPCPMRTETHIRPEYMTMSNRPGIGKGWFEKNYKEVYPIDTVIMDGKEYRPPTYYDTLYKSLASRWCPKTQEEIVLDDELYQNWLNVKARRQRLAIENSPGPDSTLAEWTAGRQQQRARATRTLQFTGERPTSLD